MIHQCITEKKGACLHVLGGGSDGPLYHEILILDLSVHALAEEDADRFAGLVSVVY